ncbi:GNAT family N-acetyltransferase [Amnibacterium sp. CER49]|uniref:GNAT family N-acetyltransferase n=1 Tax=Amnibacterium sp. CER49 TaxID=3039161 RepID=UPI00244A41CE|nr:GNAT family N-acetyltransferase [Amnibacterium sp. CER49]MDH2444235.1 GNAT family N-acetyltransferase [Amnibacterium sp. CER49]
MAVVVCPATTVPFSDVEHALTGGGDGGGCWCQWFLLPRRDFDAAGREGLRERLRVELAEAEVAPALVAHVAGEAAGWVRVAPRTTQPVLARSPIVRRGSVEPPTAADVWAITCLVVRREHRGQGLAHRLVEAATEHAAASGARTIEAYPIDTGVRAPTSTALYHGSIDLFERAGFTVVARPTPGRAVMSRPASPSPS